VKKCVVCEMGNINESVKQYESKVVEQPCYTDWDYERQKRTNFFLVHPETKTIYYSTIHEPLKMFRLRFKPDIKKVVQPKGLCCDIFCAIAIDQSKFFTFAVK
jgi:hypothetical protein